MKNKKKDFQKGFAVFLSILIMAVVLVSILGLSVLLTGQHKTIRTVGHSVNAFYATETGAEKAIFTTLTALKNKENFYYKQEETLDNGAEYTVSTYCCHPDNNDCEIDKVPDCPAKFSGNASRIDENCNATMFCIYSTGSFEGIKRTIEIEIYPKRD